MIKKEVEETKIRFQVKKKNTEKTDYRKLAFRGQYGVLTDVGCEENRIEEI